MSTEASMATPKAHKKSHKTKHKDASSKKRQREEIASPAPTSTSSPSKKRRKGVPAPSSSSKPAVSKSSKPKSANASSPFVEQTISFYLPLSPIANDFAIQGLCAEHISPLLLTYYPPLSGFLLSYTNPRLSDHPSQTAITESTPAAAAAGTETGSATVMSRANDEYGVTLVWLTLDATILRATPGAYVEGHIRLQNENYIGLVCWNFFNAVIKRRRLPGDWTWVPGGEGRVGDGGADVARLRQEKEKEKAKKGEKSKADEDDGGSDSSSVVSSDSEEEAPTSAQRLPAASQDETVHLGHFVDGRGKPVDELVRFMIKNYECAPSNERERGFISLEGSLLDDAADRAEDEKVMAEFKAAGKSRRTGRMMG